MRSAPFRNMRTPSRWRAEKRCEFRSISRLRKSRKLIDSCDAVLLPGSKADVDPAKYKAAADPKTAPADPRRDAVDELLLQDAYTLRKPVLGICYGLQILNVYRRRNAVAAHRVAGQSRSGKKRADRAHGGGGLGLAG